MRPRAEPQCREKTWRISVVPNKRRERFGVEKETTCRKWRYRQPTNGLESTASASNLCAPGRDRRGLFDALYKGLRDFSLKLEDLPFNADFRDSFDFEAG